MNIQESLSLFSLYKLIIISDFTKILIEIIAHYHIVSLSLDHGKYFFEPYTGERLLFKKLRIIRKKALLLNFDRILFWLKLSLISFLNIFSFLIDLHFGLRRLQNGRTQNCKIIISTSIVKQKVYIFELLLHFFNHVHVNANSNVFSTQFSRFFSKWVLTPTDDWVLTEDCTL